MTTLPSRGGAGWASSGLGASLRLLPPENCAITGTTSTIIVRHTRPRVAFHFPLPSSSTQYLKHKHHPNLSIQCFSFGRNNTENHNMNKIVPTNVLPWKTRAIGFPLLFTKSLYPLKLVDSASRWSLGAITGWWFQPIWKIFQTTTQIISSCSKWHAHLRHALPNVAGANTFHLELKHDSCSLEELKETYQPIASMYGIFTYIYHILPLKTTKCR